MSQIREGNTTLSSIKRLLEFIVIRHKKLPIEKSRDFSSFHSTILLAVKMSTPHHNGVCLYFVLQDILRNLRL